MKTNVKFLIETVDQQEYIFAFFPNERHNRVNPQLMVCYAHTGQHSSCSIDYANQCKEANFNQYQDLLKELIGQGYKNLNILNAQKIECWRPPTKGEIRFGEGATHYRDFTVSEIGLNKKGDLKKWFVADDGLRYYK